MSDKIVRADARGRLSLGDSVKPSSLYLATVHDNGVITLEPAVAVKLTDLKEKS